MLDHPKAHILLIIAAVIIPYVFHTLLGTSVFRKILKFMKINTNIDDNPMDVALFKEKPLWVCAYMDELNVMYEGFVRNYVSDIERFKYIMLSQYRISRLDNDTNQYEQTYPPKVGNTRGDVSKKDWVILDMSNVTRIEIVYKSEH